MKIGKVLTWHWGSLEDREWVFADRVLLTGETGSGKSTLLDAIQTVLTAAHHHLVQFNISQDESTQSGRGGKEPRTLAAYALGQQADGVFLRSRSTSYAAIVFEGSTDETAKPLTALVGVEALEDGKQAKLSRNLFFIIRSDLSFEHLTQREGEALQPAPIVLKDLYLQLQHRLQAGPETVQRFEDKGGYLQHLYGALMGKTAVSEAEAMRAAKSIVKAMAYKQLGNVNDLVKDEILDQHDFGHDLDKMRELMRSMTALKSEAERLQQNLNRLDTAAECAEQVLGETRRFVITTIAHALRARLETEHELASVRRQLAAQQKRHAQLHAQLASLQAQEEQLRDQQRIVQIRLDNSDVAREKAKLESDVHTQASQFRLHWSAVQQAVQNIDQMASQLQQLLALDLTAVPPLAEAAAPLRPTAATLLKHWPAMKAAYLAEAQLNSEFPAFELEDFDAQLLQLERGIHGGDESVPSVQAAVVQALTDVGQRLNQLKDEHTERDAELRVLQSGRAAGPRDAHEAVGLIERDLPQARPHLLAQLVEPKLGSTWQRAIEGYMGGDRFALIVEAGWEARCTRLIKQRFPQRSPKVVQGSKAIADTEGRQLEPRAMLHELEATHPVAKAFLMAQYGRVRKVESEDELARTPQGLMEQGLGSRGYGMFACQLPANELAFGEAARLRRRQWCEAELQRLTRDMAALAALRQSLNGVARMFAGAAFLPLAPRLLAVLESQRHHAHAAQALAALDLSSIEALLQARDTLNQRIKTIKQQYDEDMKQVGATDKQLADLTQREAALVDSLPLLGAACTNACVWATRFVAVVPQLATEPQLMAEAGTLADDTEVSLSALHQRILAMNLALSPQLRTLAMAVGDYLSHARDDAERFEWQDPPKSFERLEELLPLVFAVREAVALQSRRQRAIGLAENTERLRDAESRFNQVFTTSFCFKVRDDIRQGAATLQRLNRYLKDIRFGVDTFELQWDWIPRMQKIYEFFEAVETITERLEQARGSIFESPLLADDHRATAGDIRQMLLANDQGSSERALREIADYRSYRRYDILRLSPVGQTRLSTWGSGSGGELETPFYLLRAVVLAHALGHFGRGHPDAPALKLMLNDEAFSRMDESRSRSVLQFLSESLKLQLIVAMPTSKSGAVKPEFDKEFTFSKVLARREGRDLLVSEAQEKTLHRQALNKLWQTHALQAREAARKQHLAGEGKKPPMASGDKGDA